VPLRRPLTASLAALLLAACATSEAATLYGSSRPGPRTSSATAPATAPATLAPAATPGTTRSPTAVVARAPATASSRPSASRSARPTSSPRPTVVSPRGSGSAALPSGSGAGRRIVYSVPRQRVWLVGSDGAVVRTYLVSGQTRQPAAGSYRVYSKSLSTASSSGSVTMRYMVRFAVGRYTGTAVGFHDIPRQRDGTRVQSEADLGRPVSHGCVRQRTSDAAALWAFARVGTRVVVVR